MRETSKSELDNILQELSAYSKWHPDLKKFNADIQKDHNFRSPYGLNDESLAKSIAHQLVNFLAHHQGKGFTRDQLLQVESAIIKSCSALKKSSDIIQCVNKTNQKGLKRFFVKIDGKVNYGLDEIDIDDRYILSRTDSTTGIHRSSSESSIRKQFYEFSKESYEKGHMDPSKPLSDDNCVMQPRSLNRAYRDNYKFGPNGLPLAPMPDYIAKDPGRFYNREQWEKILDIGRDYLNKLNNM